MRFTAFIAAVTFSSAVFAASASTNSETDLSSILEALRANNPEDADAAAAAMKIKLRVRDPAPQVAGGQDLNAILAALEANSPEDAAAARQGQSAGSVAKRQEDLNAILAALEANNPEDAAAARQNV